MNNALSLVRRFIQDDRGAEGLEKLLIIAAVVLPLLGLLIFFRGEITDWITGLWEGVRGDAEDYDFVP